MSESALKALMEIRAKMAEEFGKKPCTVTLSVNEILAIKLTIETILRTDANDFEQEMLKLVPMRLQQALDGVKP